MKYFIIKEKKIPDDITYQKGGYKVIEEIDENGKKEYFRIDDFADKRKKVKINVNSLSSLCNYKGAIFRGCLSPEVKVLVYQDLFGIKIAYLICTGSPPLGLRLVEIEDLDKSINDFVISD